LNRLDIVGNTLSAIVKGYTTGSGGLVSFGIYGAIMMSLDLKEIDISSLNNFVFLFLGALFTYVIQSYCLSYTGENSIILVTLILIR
jgi:Na+/H+-translocating membrane pyrophosphatase